MDKDVRIAQLEAEVAELKRLLTAALDENARLKRTSRTSSKPPSSDIIKPPASSGGGAAGSSGGGGKGKKRKPGGQPGHHKHIRVPYTAEQIDAAWEYHLEDVGDEWEALDDFHILQQVELRENPLIITEHRFRRYLHRLTGKIINAPVPEDLRRQGLLGPRLRAMTAMLKGQCHVSYRPIQALYRDALGLKVSTGQLAKVVGQCGDALAEPYTDLLVKLRQQPAVNVDETGHATGGQRGWLWCAVAEALTVFKVAASRAAAVLEELLGPNYRGIVGSDFFSAYRKFAAEHGSAAAYCWAHLIRDIRYLTTLNDQVIVNWANKLLNQVKKLFKAYHGQGKRAQRNARDTILKQLRYPPRRAETQTLAARIKTNAAAYFLFLEDDRVEPTNNRAERALRHAVIDRRITQGTRSPAGSRWLERFLSIRETCRQQDRSLFDYLVQAITHHTAGKPVPVLG